MGATDGPFNDAIGKILSAQHQAMQAASGAWTALANAAGAESGALSGTASQAAGERGAGLLELSDRLEATGGWAQGAAAVARQIADQLIGAADRSAQASERALALQEEYTEWETWRAERMETLPDGPALSVTHQAAEAGQQALTDEAQTELDALSSEIARVIGGDAPAAPEGGAGSGAVPMKAAIDGGAGSAGAAGAATAAAAPASGGSAAGGAAAPTYEAPNGSVIGAGSYPHSRVLGPEQGDFAGWVQSPNTGFLVDPATGREFDPVAGRWIDPVTGEPFGAVTEYATRLSGLGAGPGAIASGGGLAAGGAGPAATAGLAGLYGGIMPPSVGHTGPARNQVMQQAARNLGQRARVATRFAMHEAAQGGRPFVPPPGASSSRGPTARPGLARPGRTGLAARTPVIPPGRDPLTPGGRSLLPPPGASSSRSTSQAGRTAPTGRPGYAPGSRAGMPPPGASSSRGTAPVGRAARAATATSARPGSVATAGASRAFAAPHAGGATAARGLAPAGRPATAAPPPAPGAGSGRGNQGRGEGESHNQRTTDLTEDPEVWSSHRSATRGVLGE